MSEKIFYSSLLSFFLGIASFSIFKGKIILVSELFFYLLLILIIFIGIFLYLKYSQKKIPRVLSLIFFSLLFFIGGYGRSFIFEKQHQGNFDHLLGKKINLKMIIDEEVEQKDYKQKIILKFPNSDSRAIL